MLVVFMMVPSATAETCAAYGMNVRVGRSGVERARVQSSLRFNRKSELKEKWCLNVDSREAGSRPTFQICVVPEMVLESAAGCALSASVGLLKKALLEEWESSFASRERRFVERC